MDEENIVVCGQVGRTSYILRAIHIYNIEKLDQYSNSLSKKCREKRVIKQ